MNKIIIEGNQNFMGKEIPIISGGFGIGCKVISTPQIAIIHNRELKDVNKGIKRLIERNRFKISVDYLDIKGDCEVPLSEFGWNGRNIANAFILSERGYSKLIKYMDDDKSWDIHDRLIDEYFAMREVISSQEQLRNQLLLQLFSNDEMMVANAHKQLLDLETKPLLEKIETIEPLADKYHIYLDVDGLTDIATFSKNLGVKSLGRNNMYKFLKENKYLMNDNNPYQKYVDQGIFLVKPNGKHIVNGENVQDFKTYVTKKGVDYLINKLKKDGKIA